MSIQYKLSQFVFYNMAELKSKRELSVDLRDKSHDNLTGNLPKSTQMALGKSSNLT